MDWTATLLARAGAQPDPRTPLDGIDLLPALTGSAPPVARQFFWRIFQRSQQHATRSGSWKYLATETGEHLFDLASDPGEQSDLKTQQFETFARLKEEYRAWERTVLDPIPLDPNFR